MTAHLHNSLGPSIYTLPKPIPSVVLGRCCKSPCKVILSIVIPNLHTQSNMFYLLFIPTKLIISSKMTFKFVKDIFCINYYWLIFHSLNFHQLNSYFFFYVFSITSCHSDNPEACQMIPHILSEYYHISIFFSLQDFFWYSRIY